MGYTEEEINQSLIAFDIDKDDGHITREEQRLIEISLVKKRSKKCAFFYLIMQYFEI